MYYKDDFKGKKITLMGLGLLGRGLGDAVFLANHGAELTITDLRDKKTLAPSISKFQNIKISKPVQLVLGKHRLEDFRGRDFILKAAGVSLDSPYLAEARKNGIPIEMDASLFAKLMPKGVTLVGVTGTRGKSTVTALIYEILKAFTAVRLSKGDSLTAVNRVFLAGNVKDTATLPLLKKVKAGDCVVLELDSWQLQGFGEAKMSPHVAVCTNFMDDHLNYYKEDREQYWNDKANIFRFQKRGDFLVAGEQVIGRMLAARPPAKPIIARAADIPGDWNLKIPGGHNRANAACAVAAARAIKIPEAIIKKAIENFRGLPGRLEYVRTVRGVKIYNDNSATTPDATIAALKTLGTRQEGARKIILICGGTDKVLGKHDELVDEISKRCKAVVLLKETGTDKLRPKLETVRSNFLQIKEADGLPACTEEATKIAKRGDTVLFSPAFASFGKWFKNEYDRGERFMNIVKNLHG